MMNQASIKNNENLNKISKEYNFYDSVIISLPIHNQDVIFPFNNENLDTEALKRLQLLISAANKILKDNSILFIYGSPIQLIKSHEIMPSDLRFRYWIALDMLDCLEQKPEDHLKHNHLGILMLIKGKKFLSLDTKNTRVKHLACSACLKNIKDWGGKKHLMNINGTGLSDIWKDFYNVVDIVKDTYRKEIKLHKIDSYNTLFQFEYTKMPESILKRLLSLIEEDHRRVLLLNCNHVYLSPLNQKNELNLNLQIKKTNQSKIINQVIMGDCIKKMKELSDQYPEGIFDLVFADPPYNLSKEYKKYDDNLEDSKYINWCNNWLKLMVKLTKTTGNIIILNTPNWALEHAKYLNNIAYFQNWIAWDALSTPKGKIMPAHYALLYYTKQPIGFTFNKPEDIDSPEYCLRQSCINERNKINMCNKVPLSDIWWDIHRIKHKKDRDDHPCQLPINLMKRIIKIFTNEGDIVLDPLAGAGTTAIAAKLLGRNYITIDNDEYYIEIIKEKLQQIEYNGKLIRVAKQKRSFSIYTKKGFRNKITKVCN